MKTDLKDLVNFISTVVGGDIRAQSRKQDMVYARAVFVKIAREEFGLTLTAIGRLLGDRTHATILNSEHLGSNLMGYQYILDSALVWVEHNEELIVKGDPDAYVKLLSRRVSKLKNDMVAMSFLEDHELSYRKLPKDKQLIFKERVDPMIRMLRLN